MTDTNSNNLPVDEGERFMLCIHDSVSCLCFKNAEPSLSMEQVEAMKENWRRWK